MDTALQLVVRVNTVSTLIYIRKLTPRLQINISSEKFKENRIIN